MVRVLKRTAARCAHIAKTYSIGRSFDGRELLVLELSSRPGQHELSKPLWPQAPGREARLLAEGSGLRGPGSSSKPQCLGDGAREGAAGCAWPTGGPATSTGRVRPLSQSCHGRCGGGGRGQGPGDVGGTGWEAGGEGWAVAEARRALCVV